MKPQSKVNELERKINSKVTCDQPNNHGYKSRSNSSYSSNKTYGAEEKFCLKCKTLYYLDNNGFGDKEPDKHAETCSQLENNPNGNNSNRERERERKRKKETNFPITNSDC
jgi:hypothetical protein